MSVLPPASRRRLLKLPQDSGTWEGGWQPLPAQGRASIPEGSCILWADRSQAFVRMIEVLPGEPDPETVARTLLRAMEQPQHPSRPGRPQKVVVQDRQLQFYLRGVLQELEIQVEYAPKLPLVAEIFEGLKNFLHLSEETPEPPAELDEIAEKIWEQAPWRYLSDHHILALELNHWDLETLYLSLMGNAQMEYGVLAYRSLESLRKFRQKAMERTSQTSMEEMQAAFLSQDCLFLNYEPDEEPETNLLSLFGPNALTQDEDSELIPEFGSIHPIEGIRQHLHEEEVAVMYVALTALSQFWQQHQRKLKGKAVLNGLPDLKSTLEIDIPESMGGGNLTVTMATQPQLATDLLNMGAEDSDLSLTTYPEPAGVLQDDLVPDGSIFSIGSIPWELVEMARAHVRHHQAGETKSAGDGMPVIMVQTSQPKAKIIIANLKKAGGIVGMGFSLGRDPFGDPLYDLGVVKTADHQFHLLGEFDANDAVHKQAKQKWQKRCKSTKGWCGVLIAKGVTGASRGKLRVQDMLALFEVRQVSGEEMGLGDLRMMPRY
jgi:hypothetical protein